MIWASFQPCFCYHFSFSPQSYLSICHQHITPTLLHLPSRCHPKATSQGASKCNLMCALPSQIRVAFHAPGLREPNRHYLLDNWRGGWGEKGKKGHSNKYFSFYLSSDWSKGKRLDVPNTSLKITGIHWLKTPISRWIFYPTSRWVFRWQLCSILFPYFNCQCMN